MGSLLLVSALVYSQSINALIGFSPRSNGRGVVGLQYSQHITGYEDLSIGAMANAVYEHKEGNSVAASLYLQTYEWRAYAGASYFTAISDVLAEGSRPYFMAGISWLPQPSPGRKFSGGMDLRYQGDAIYLTFVVSLNLKKP